MNRQGSLDEVSDRIAGYPHQASSESWHSFFSDVFLYCIDQNESFGVCHEFPDPGRGMGGLSVSREARQLQQERQLGVEGQSVGRLHLLVIRTLDKLAHLFRQHGLLWFL